MSVLLHAGFGQRSLSGFVVCGFFVADFAMHNIGGEGVLNTSVVNYLV